MPGSSAISFLPETSFTLLWDQIDTNRQDISKLVGPNSFFFLTTESFSQINYLEKPSI